MARNVSWEVETQETRTNNIRIHLENIGFCNENCIG